MNLRFIAAVAISTAIFIHPCSASALTMEQFTAICDAQQGECSEHPLLQAYVGGALDLIAMLDEETDYLSVVYCGEPSGLFDVPTIIRYMETHRDGYADRNAMLLVIRYFEENGGC